MLKRGFWKKNGWRNSLKMYSHCGEKIEIQRGYNTEKKYLLLSEYDTLTVYENEEGFNELFLLLDKELTLINVQAVIEGQKALKISASSKVGVERINEITVFVQTKIKDADFLTMINYAYDFDIDFLKNTVYLQNERCYPAVFFMIYFLFRAQEFVRTQLKRHFIKEEKDFSSKVKGKILLSAYVKKSKAVCRDNVVPCQFYEIKYDCLENQIIRYTVDIINQVLPRVMISSMLRKEMQKLCRDIISRMETVTLKRITLTDFNKVRHTGKFKNYQYIHQLCRMVLESLRVETKGGNSVKFKSFSLDMNLLFERFIIGVLKKETKLEVDYQKNEKIFIGNNSKRIFLDGWINKKNIVIETKYKDFFQFDEEVVGVTALGTLKIKNSDIYQVTAYCNHNKINAFRGILVYPVSQRDEHSDYYEIKGFNKDIYVIPISISFTIKDSGKPQEISNFVNAIGEIIY